MNIYVGNVDYRTKEDQLRELFEEFGEVTSTKMITDKLTGRSKGFAFVEMSQDEEAKEAIEALNGKLVNNREITVSEAKPRTEDGGGYKKNNYNNNRGSQRY